MHELDLWIDANVIGPLVVQGDPMEEVELTEEAIDKVKKAIRDKVLESYHNGQAAGPRKSARFKARQF